MSKKYTIKLCRSDEIEELKGYINKWWKKDHILVKSPELFKWQYISGNNINIVIARNTLSKEIDGIMGFLPTYHFDPDLKEFNEFWGALWSTNENAAPGLGMVMMRYVWKRYNPDSYGGLGISSIAKRMYMVLNQHMGGLNQYFYVNKLFKDYNIAVISQATASESSPKSQFTINELYSLENITLKHSFKPIKSITYLINRYQKHPIYKYRFLGIYFNEKLLCIWVIRKQYVGSDSCLRIIDMYGNIVAMGDLRTELDRLLNNENAEYIDCLNHGLSETLFEIIGFKKLDFEGKDIIPNYFEPFLKENIQIEFAIDKMSRDYLIFKGDGDLDRPSLVLK